MTLFSRKITESESWVLDFAATSTESTRPLSEQITVTDWGNSTIYLVDADDKSCVIKVPRKSNFEKICQWQREIGAFRQRLSVDSSRIRTPKILGVHETPPAFAMEHLNGEAGGPWLADQLSSGRLADKTESLIQQWGRSFALFHRASLDDEQRRAAKSTTEERFHGLWQRLGLPLRNAAKLNSGLITCRSHNDVGFHNVIILRDGCLGFIDFFESNIVTTIHEDVADVLAWLEDAYRDCSRKTRRKTGDLLSKKFLEGYQEESGIDFSDPTHQRLLDFFLLRSHMLWVPVAAARRHYIQAIECALRGLRTGVKMQVLTRWK